MNPSDIGLVETLCSTVGNPAAWSTTLGKMVERLGANHALLVDIGSSPQPSSLVESFGLDETDVARFTSERAWNLWRPLHHIVPIGRPVLQREMISDRDMERAEFYQELVRPTGGFHSLSVHQTTGGRSHQLILCRLKSKGEFEQEDADRFQPLLPHLLSAYIAHKRLQLAESRIDGLAAALDRLEDGIILLNDAGRVDFVNANAQLIVEQAEIWLATTKGIEQGGTGLPIRLRDAVLAFHHDPQRRQRRLYVETTKGKGDWVIVEILSLSRFGLAMRNLAQAQTAVLLKPLTNHPQIDRQALQDLYQLTSRESEVAALLAGGKSLEAIGKKTDLTANTVRFYLKQIYAKMGVSNQAGLVAALRPFVLRTRPLWSGSDCSRPDQ